MSKFKDWTDEELEVLSEVFQICYDKGGITSGVLLDPKVVTEFEDRKLDMLPWMDCWKHI